MKERRDGASIPGETVDPITTQESNQFLWIFRVLFYEVSLPVDNVTPILHSSNRNATR